MIVAHIIYHFHTRYLFENKIFFFKHIIGKNRRKHVFFPKLSPKKLKKPYVFILKMRF